MMLLMALSLAASGCGKGNDYKTNGYEKIQEIMDNSEFYKSESLFGTYEETYAPFYQNYIRLFAKYMTEEQYNYFLMVVKGMNREEPYDFVNTYNYLDKIFDITSIKEGRCFFRCFNSRLMSENYDLFGINELRGITPHIATIRSVVNNDDAFFKSVFSGDINKVIDCICKNTGYDNRELVEELMLKMDLYYDIAESQEYMDIELRKNYEARISEIIGFIIEAKCANYEEFNNSLYGRLLKESAYLNKDSYNYNIIPSISEDTFYITVYGEENYRIYQVDRQYLYEDISLEEIREIQATKIIDQAMHPSEDNWSSVEDTMKLLMSLIDADIFNTQELPDSNAIRLAMYENLSAYFASPDEFNTFIIKLFDSRQTTFAQYFNLLAKRIEEDGISYNDFIRYLCLVNYNKDRTFTRIYFSGSYEEMQANYVPDEEIRAMKRSEWEPIAYTIQDNYIFGELVPYLDYFAEVEKVLADNDLGYELIFNPDCQYTWENGEANVTNLENSSVLSSYINPKTMEYNGSNVVYYEVPECYEDADAVETFYNIADELITRDVKGFKTNIEDPETGEEKLVFISRLTDSLEEPEPIRFILDYPTFIKYQNLANGKGLYLGGSYE